MLRSDPCDFRDAYIFVKVTITLTKDANRNFTDIRNRFLAFENNALFTNFISKINNVLIENAEDLDVLMSMYNLLECSKNYKKITGSLWNYYRDKPNVFHANNYNTNPITNSGSFKYKSVLQEQHHMKIKKMMKTLRANTQKLKKEKLKLLFR